MPSDELIELWEKYQLGFQVEPWFNESSLPPETGILLIRHGPRTSPDIPPLSAMLTLEGIKKCSNLGLRIRNHQPDVIYSSPVKRCLDTAFKILNSANWACKIIELESLGHLGPFVIEKHSKDVRLLVDQSIENDDWSFLQEHISGIKEFKGMRNREEGTAFFLNSVISADNNYIMCISHDSIIAAISASFGLGDDKWPEPLDGICIIPKEGFQW